MRASAAAQLRGYNLALWDTDLTPLGDALHHLKIAYPPLLPSGRSPSSTARCSSRPRT